MIYTEKFNGLSLYIEGDNDGLSVPSEPTTTGSSDFRIVDLEEKGIPTLKEIAKSIATGLDSTITESFENSSGMNEVSVSLKIGLSAECGGWILKTKSEGHFSLNILWKKEDAKK